MIRNGEKSPFLLPYQYEEVVVSTKDEDFPWSALEAVTDAKEAIRSLSSLPNHINTSFDKIYRYGQASMKRKLLAIAVEARDSALTAPESREAFDELDALVAELEGVAVEEKLGE